MTEWRLFDETPDFTTREFFAEHPHVPSDQQVGHRERTGMVAEMVTEHLGPASTLTDLGCGDGTLLFTLRHLPVRAWGYDAGRRNVEQARIVGLDVRRADFLTDEVELGDIVVMSEVLEHLADPHGMLARLAAQRIVVSSPSSETGSWHYVHHAWAWDEAGFKDLLEGTGWTVLEQRTVYGGINHHCGRDGEQWFQAAVAIR
jgi:predicted TPR repeat methyltransferase